MNAEKVAGVVSVLLVSACTVAVLLRVVLLVGVLSSVPIEGAVGLRRKLRISEFQQFVIRVVNGLVNNTAFKLRDANFIARNKIEKGRVIKLSTCIHFSV